MRGPCRTRFWQRPGPLIPVPSSDGGRGRRQTPSRVNLRNNPPALDRARRPGPPARSGCGRPPRARPRGRPGSSARRRRRPASRPSSAPGGAGTTARRPRTGWPRPRCRTSSRSRVRTGDFAWHCESRKVVKSCRPISTLAASRIASTSSLCLTAPGAAAVEGQRRAAVDDPVNVNAAARAAAGVEIVRRALGLQRPRPGSERDGR